MEEQAALYDQLASRDYNRTKAGLGSGASADEPAGQAAAVAAHYNALGDRHRTLHSGSDILHLRNLNNFVKSVLIGKYLLPNQAVLDLACGKGGDLLKFKAGRCALYVGIDIALKSVRDAAARYNGSHSRASLPFPATFAAGDFSAVSLDAHLPAEMRFQLVSCQFALHYSFGSEARAVQLLANAASRLQPGGVFVATIPDANVLVRRLRAAPALTFGSSIYNVSFAPQHASKSFSAESPFGIAYDFTLKEAVDNCTEYLVPLPTLTRLARQVGLELEEAKNFTDFFATEWGRNRDLLERMRVLPDGASVSEEEWEVAHTYMIVAFRKGAPNRPPPQRNPGHRPVADHEILILEGSDGAAPPAAGGSGVKRPRGGGAGEADAEEDDGGRRKVRYDEDALFD